MLPDEIKRHWPMVAREIRSILYMDNLPNAAKNMLEHQSGLGGKHLRPLLVVLAAQAFGLKAHSTYKLAAAVELIHEASLVHDDIQDGDETRRGQPTAWKTFGAGQAINLGNWLFASAFIALHGLPYPDECRLRANGLALDAIRDLVAGQVLDLSSMARVDIAEETYQAIARHKTGSLFALTLAGPAVLAQQQEPILRSLWDLGQSLGHLFQIRDDLIDALGKKEGRAAGEDIAEGKATLMVVHLSHCRTLNAEELDRYGQIIAKPKKHTTAEEVGWVLQLYQQHGALGHARNRYKQIAERIRHDPILPQFPNLRSGLHSLLESLTSALR